MTYKIYALIVYFFIVAVMEEPDYYSDTLVCRPFSYGFSYYKFWVQTKAKYQAAMKL